MLCRSDLPLLEDKLTCLLTISRLEEAIASALLAGRCLEDQSDALDGSDMDGCLLLGPFRDFPGVFACDFRFRKVP